MRQLQKLKAWYHSEQAARTRDRMGSFLETLDNKNFILLSVCILPGALAAQLVSTFQIPQPAGMIATGLLLIGGLIYWRWSAIRKRFKTDQEQAEESANEQTYVEEEIDGQALMQELLDLHGGNEPEATKAVMVELKMDPTLNWDGGVFVALRRKRAVDQLAS